MPTTDRTLSPPLRLGLADQGRPTTADEFAEADFDEPYRYERVAGRLVVMSPQGQRHVDGSQPWMRALYRYWLDRGPLIDHVNSEAWVRIGDQTDRIGDIGVYLATPPPATPIPDRVPELVFEVVSPGRKSRERDYVAKRADYHRLGVREYVIVDPVDRRVTVLSYTPDLYLERVLGPADTYTTPLLPGFALPLAGALGPEEADDGDD